MTTPDLLDYIRSQTEIGATRKDISINLLGQGWTAEDVDEGFMTVFPAASKPAAATAVAPAAVPAVSIAPSVTPAAIIPPTIVVPAFGETPMSPPGTTPPLETALATASAPTSALASAITHAQPGLQTMRQDSSSILMARAMGRPIAPAQFSVGTLASDDTAGHKKSHGGLIAAIIILLIIILAGGISYAACMGVFGSTFSNTFEQYLHISI